MRINPSIGSMVSTIWYKKGENHEGIQAIDSSRNVGYPLVVRRQNDINFDNSAFAMKTKPTKMGTLMKPPQ